jgi:hypothetical protein
VYYISDRCARQAKLPDDAAAVKLEVFRLVHHTQFWFLLVLLVPCAIEVIQIHLPGRVAEITDPLLVLILALTLGLLDRSERVLSNLSSLTSGLFAQNDYLLWFARDHTKLRFRQLFMEKGVDSDLSFYAYVEVPGGERQVSSMMLDLYRVKTKLGLY